jgi:hypothetical protein
MSELKVDKVSPRSGNYVALNTVGMKNIIINGDMSIAQRGTTFTGNTTSNYMVDRFTQNINGAIGTWTNGQSTEVPTGQGFANSLIMDCTTADAAPAAADFVRVEQRFEGQNLQYIKKGTANAESLTLSFWVKSNKTGTYIAELEDRDNSRYVSKSYTVDVTDTWEFKTATFPGDTTGTLNNDNGESLRLNFWLGAGATWTSGTLGTTWHTTAANRAVGQVNLADDTSNDWYITGVQLEAGTTASDFEFLPVDVNTQRCQRYFQKSPTFMGVATNTTTIHTNIDFPTKMRATPSLTTNGTIRISEALANFDSTADPADVSGNADGIGVTQASFSGLTQFRAYLQNVSQGSYLMDSEL